MKKQYIKPTAETFRTELSNHFALSKQDIVMDPSTGLSKSYGDWNDDGSSDW